MTVCPTCSKCLKEATFDSPKDLCEDHWVEWWVEGLNPQTPEERQKLTEECLKALREEDDNS